MGWKGLIHLSSLAPGDALREISRSIELDLFREYQRRQRAVALIRMLLGDSPREVCAADVMRALTGKFQAVYELMLSGQSATQAAAGICPTNTRSRQCWQAARFPLKNKRSLPCGQTL